MSLCFLFSAQQHAGCAHNREYDPENQVRAVAGRGNGKLFILRFDGYQILFVAIDDIAGSGHPAEFMLAFPP